MKKIYKFIAALCLTCIGYPISLSAADVLENPADSLRTNDLDEVVVTSQPKDSYRLRLQPLSASMFSADDMQELGARDLRQLSQFVPSVAMPEYGSRLTSSIYVRGVGSRINNPAVGVYVDNMPLLSKTAYNFHVYDVERIDMLRGPQSTLYGQNTEGGLLRVYTRNPMNYQGTDVNLSVGTHFLRNIEVAHHHRFSDAVGLSVAAFYGGTNGFRHNQYDDQRADRMNEAGARARLVLRPSSRLTLDVVADYQYVRENAFPYGLYDVETGCVESPNTNRQSNYRRNIFNTAVNLKYSATAFDVFSTTSYQYLKDYMLMDQDYLPVDYMHLQQRQFQNALSEELVFKSKLSGIWRWSTGFYLSKSWLKTNAPVDFGEGITTPIANGIQTAMYNSMLRSMAARMMQQGMPEQMAMAAAAKAIENAGGVSMDVNMEVPGLFRTPQFNLGVFHESNIEITPALTATVGLRYDYNRQSINYDTQAAMAMTANVMGTEATYTLLSHLQHHERENFNQLLPKFGLSYRIDESGSNIYATVSKGYRVGGFNIQMFSDVLQTELNANSQQAMRGDYEVPHTEEDYERLHQTISYKPEVSWNYELGSHLNLFDRALRIDLALYYMQVRDQQLSIMTDNYGYGRQMVNAGKSFSCGLEAALSGQLLSDRLTWSLGYGLTHAEFKEYSDDREIDGATVHVDFSGKRVPFVPMHTLSAAADYRWPVIAGPLTALSVGANVSAQGRIYWDEYNEASQPFYAVAGANVAAYAKNITLRLWCRNLTDTRYNTFAVSSAAAGETLYFAQRGNPFQLGIDLNLHF